MKKKNFLSVWALFWVSVLLLFCGCSGEEMSPLKVPDNKVEAFLTYDWSTKQDNDTTWLICDQTVRYETEDGSNEAHAKASVKLWPEKEIVYFNAERNPQPEYESESTSSGESGDAPVVKTIRKNFLFKDGQNVTAEIRCERYSHLGVKLPYVEITDVRFQTSEAKETTEENTFDATVSFAAMWQEKASGHNENGEKPLAAAYTKIRSEKTDELLNTEYNSGHVWNGNSVTLIVEKIETWSLSGTKKQEFSSPSLPFALTAKNDKALEVNNFDFTGKLSSARTSTEDLSAEGWTLSKTVVVNTFQYGNGSEEFNDVFDYPLYTARYDLDGKTFDFDLSVDFRHSDQMDVENADKANHMTTATAIILNKPFTQVATTLLSLNKDEPNPTPDPDHAYGKIISFSVSAVFDPSELHKNGNITKKCVIVRYEKGYEWGICEYGDNFPASFSFTNSGYSGFNSAAMDTAQSPFQPARAEDKSDGICWYGENNKLLAGIDIITCKVYGWKNTVNGKYSHIINGYKAEYSQDRYTMSLTAPDGSVVKFTSSAIQ